MDLRIEALHSAEVLSDFECGIEPMDRFIHSNLEFSVRNNFCKLYAVRTIQHELVAMFALCFDSLRLDSDDKEDLQLSYAGTTTPQIDCEYDDTFWCKAHYPALEIAYLAVDKRYQKLHIGKDIVEAIVDKAKSQTLAGCQFVTVEAYCTKEYSAVDFYTKCGFANADIVPIYDTVRMYRNLLE